MYIFKSNYFTMKLFFVFVALLAASFSVNAVSFDDSNNSILEQNLDEERYVIVYKMNGVTHAVIINHYVDCEALFALNPENATILDCGPLNSVTPPSGTTYVNEEQALSNFGIEEWPV